MTDTPVSTVVLPLELAPSLAARVRRLLREVSTTAAPELVVEVPYQHRCVVCHRGGKVGGHHGSDGSIQWIHAKCHRRLHRSGRHQVAPAPLPRRRTPVAC